MKRVYPVVIIVLLIFAIAPSASAIELRSSKSVRSMQYFYYLRYNKALEKFNELYNKSVELGVDEETVELALEYKELAEKEYELAWQFGHPLKGHFQTFVHMRKAYLHIKNAIEILEKAIEEVESL